MGNTVIQSDQSNMQRKTANIMQIPIIYKFPLLKSSS